MFPSARLGAFVAVLSLLAPQATAQTAGTDGPYWTSTPLPMSLITSPQARGTLVLMQSTSAMHLFSGITREWAVLPTSPSATFTSFNAYAIIEDGNQVHGYATRTGEVDSITVSANAQVVHGPGSSSWTSLVQDGPLIWGFSGFLGKWEPVVALSSNPTMVANQMTAVAHDDSWAYGFSAYLGTWAKTPANSSATIDCGGVVAIATSPGVVRGYSSHTGTWSVENFAGATAPALSRGFAMFTDGPEVLAYSGYTGLFSGHTSATSNFTLQTSRNVAAIVDGDEITGYAAGGGRFDTITVPGASIELNREVFLAYTANSVHAFSGVKGAFAAPLLGAFNAWTNEAVAYAEEPISATDFDSYGYSPILNLWTQAPAVTQVAVPHLSRSSVIIPTTTGYEAFSARYGVWVGQATTQIGNYAGPGSSAVFAAFDGAQSEVIRMWDTRMNRWTSLTTQGPAQLDLFRTVGLAQEPTKAYGFGLMNNVWEAIDLQGTIQGSKASSSIAYVETDSHVYTFTAHGSLSSYSRWPEFSRFQPKGTDLPTLLTAPAGSTVGFMLSIKPDHNFVAPFGTLFLDLAFLSFLQITPVVPANGLLRIPHSLPRDPAFIGFTPHLQCLVVPPSASPYITNSISPVLF